MIEDGEVRPEGCICEQCSDISPNWKDIRIKFGYEMLAEIALRPKMRKSLYKQNLYLDLSD